MADNGKVLFRTGTWAQYAALEKKDPNTLYFISDASHLEIWKGTSLYSRASEATASVSGLMSAEDKARLDALVASGGSTSVFPVYELESVDPEGDNLASYKLKKTQDGSSEYVGDTINIPKDKVLKSGTLEYVQNADNPYSGAEKGDPYLDLVLNDESASHIYIPVKDLVDVPKAGDGIAVVSNIVSIKLDSSNTHGLKVGEAGLALDLATSESDGAMSAADKKTLETLSAKYLQRNYEVVDSTDPCPIVNYNDGEIRIMFKENTVFTSQQVGAGGNPNSYYTNFKAYAPEGAVSFKEYTDSKITSMPSGTPLEFFEGNASAGMDAYGRKYTNVWLPVATKSDGDVWTYFGKQSSTDHYVGWYYGVEWYDEKSQLIGSDVIRINLSNESCHTSPKPYYMGEYALKTELQEVSDSLEWGEIE